MKYIVGSIIKKVPEGSRSPYNHHQAQIFSLKFKNQFEREEDRKQAI